MMPNPSISLARMVSIDFTSTKLKLQLGKKKLKAWDLSSWLTVTKIPSSIVSPSLSRFTILNLLSRFLLLWIHSPCLVRRRTIDRGAKERITRIPPKIRELTEISHLFGSFPKYHTFSSFAFHSTNIKCSNFAIYYPNAIISDSGQRSPVLHTPSPLSYSQAITRVITPISKYDKSPILLS